MINNPHSNTLENLWVFIHASQCFLIFKTAKTTFNRTVGVD